jgi:hypothetical protein
MLDEPEADHFTLVHGTYVLAGVLRTDHAWIELDDGRIYDAVKDSYEPADQYMARNEAVIDNRYSRLEMYRLFSVSGNVGPWTDDERGAAQARKQ